MVMLVGCSGNCFVGFKLQSHSIVQPKLHKIVATSEFWHSTLFYWIRPLPGQRFQILPTVIAWVTFIVPYSEYRIKIFFVL